MRWFCPFTLAAAVGFIPLTASADGAPQPNVAELDALITTTMRDWKVPGASVAIVRGDQVVLAK